MSGPSPSASALLPPFALSAAVVLSSPFIGQIRATLLRTFPDGFVAIVSGAVAGAIAVALVVALLTIRERRALRYTLVAGSLAIALTYSLLSATGIPEVDAVERVHFIEYGVITLLFYRALRRAGDLSTFLLPVLAGIVVGTVEEWFQWFIPNRVGEARDVLLNLVAIGCGLLFSAGLLPPDRFSAHLSSHSRQRVAAAAAAAVLVFGVFVAAVHLGHTIDAGNLTFRSRYSEKQLDSLQRDRAARWPVDPPLTLRRLSREDQYLDEGFWHVRRRNEAWSAGEYSRAWGENLILERYFSPVLDTPTFAGPPSRWSDAQRSEAAVRVPGAPQPYCSDAEPFPIVTWPRPLFLGACVSVVILLGIIVRRD